MTRTVSPSAAQPAVAPTLTRERIAMRAYEKWLQRGCPHGTDQQDWLEAEAELTAELNRTGSPLSTRPMASARPPIPQPHVAPASARRH